MSLDMRIYRFDPFTDEEKKKIDSIKDMDKIKEFLEDGYLIFNIEEEKETTKYIRSYFHVIRRPNLYYDLDKIMEMCMIPPTAELTACVNGNLYLYKDPKDEHQYQFTISDIQNIEDFIYERYSRFGIVKIGKRIDILEPELRDQIKSVGNMEKILNGGFYPLNQEMRDVILKSEFGLIKKSDIPDDEHLFYEEDY